MSTLALGRVDAFASEAPKPPTSLLQRLLKGREAQARRRVLAHLAAMDDARLAGLGFSPDDILALRAGELRLPG